MWLVALRCERMQMSSMQMPWLLTMQMSWLLTMQMSWLQTQQMSWLQTIRRLLSQAKTTAPVRHETQLETISNVGAVPP